MGSNELYHHGIKGMKWGVRRTKAQLGHATMKNKRSKKKEKEAIEAEYEKYIEQKKLDVLKSRSVRELYKNADLFSNQELRSAYDRLVFEQAIKDLSLKENIGENFAKKSETLSKTINNIASATGDLYTIYSVADKFRKSIS